MKNRFVVRAASIATFGLMAAAQTQAALMLTADGIGLGFTLTTFATVSPGNSGCCSGPFGVAVDTTGTPTVLVSANGRRYQFADVDGQTQASAFNNVAASSGTTAYATAGGLAYGGEGGRFVQFRKNGTVDHVLTGVSPSPFLGMWGNPVNGHIIATSSAGLIDIDPLAAGGAGSYRTINTASGDGVSVSIDGSIAYLENGGITAYSIASGVFLANYNNPLLAGVDGTGVISSSNDLNGDIVAVTNSGTVVLIDPNGADNASAPTYTLIASGGTRGDYASPDVSNGTLFIDTADIVYRLSCGTDCGIGSVNPPADGNVPEPGSLLLTLGALAGAGVTTRRRAPAPIHD